MLYAVCAAASARAQAFLPEDNLAYPVQVLVSGGGGSGFFVRRDRELFLVTAGHVVFDQHTWTPHASEATLRALSKDPKETAVTVLHLNVAQLLDAKEIRTDQRRDVTIVRLGALTRDGVNTTPGVVITEKSRGGMIVASFENLSRYSEVNVSSQVFMLGYPSIGVEGSPQIDYARPLVRGGIVAGLNAALKTIIIDAPINHGNSGGPVVQLSRTNRLRIIGIATQYVPAPEDSIPSRTSASTLVLGNSGYGVVASADAIIELIAEF